MTVPPEVEKLAQRRVQNANQRKASGSKREEATQVKVLIKLTGNLPLFQSDHETYTSIRVDDHYETHAVRSRAFRQWLIRAFFAERRGSPNHQALREVVEFLEAKAYSDGRQQKVHVRVAGHDGAIYLDLCNDAWEAVKVTRDGWGVVGQPPVLFRRTDAMGALPCPKTGGSLKDLRQVANLASDTNFILVAAWLTAALCPQGPYPILDITGVQGSAKSSLAKILRFLIDPSKALIRTLPRREHDLVIAAKNNWVLAFDNLSGIPPWISDALCRLSTGGGFATRKLYTDAEEIVFSDRRPVLVNGIVDVISRQDLADRALVVSLEPIETRARLTERAVWQHVRELRPLIVGALLDAVSMALRQRESTDLNGVPRMADFAHWVAAAEKALPWPVGGFLDAYEDNRAEAVELSLDADLVASAVRNHVIENGELQGTATDVLDQLNEWIGEGQTKSTEWPKSPSAFSKRLKRATTFLKAVGIEVESWREPKSGSRRIRVRVSSDSERHPRHPLSPAVPALAEGVTGGDAGDDVFGGRRDPAIDREQREI